MENGILALINLFICFFLRPSVIIFHDLNLSLIIIKDQAFKAFNGSALHCIPLILYLDWCFFVLHTHALSHIRQTHSHVPPIDDKSRIWPPPPQQQQEQQGQHGQIHN